MRFTLCCLSPLLLLACNVEPGEFSIAITPAEPVTTDSLTLTFPVESIDPQEDAVTYGITWKADGGVVADAADKVKVPAELTRKGQVWTAEAIASDGKLETGVQISAPVTILNTPPTATSVEVTPTEGLVTTAFSCTGKGFADVDEDPEGFGYRWTIDGAESGVESTIAAGKAKRGNKLVCEATPNDGEADGETVTSAPITIGNSLPSLDVVSIDPGLLTIETVATAKVGTSSDDDGDTVTYKYDWQVNGDTKGTFETLSIRPFARGDSITVTVTPFDGIDDGEPVTSEPVMVQNLSPIVDFVKALHPNTRTNGTLTATYAVRDPDGDDLVTTLSWTVNGKAVAETGLKLSGETYFDKDDKVRVKVQVFDGVATTEMESEAVTILNTKPTAPNVLIDPPVPEASDDLVCTIDRESDDVDDDTITYTFAWTQDTVAWTGKTTTTVYAGDTIAAADTTSGEDWRCTATPNDGDENGSADSDEVSVDTVDTGDSGWDTGWHSK